MLQGAEVLSGTSTPSQGQRVYWPDHCIQVPLPLFDTLCVQPLVPAVLLTMRADVLVS